jgi:hypothetical protein
MFKCHGIANVRRVSNEYKMTKLQFSLIFLLDIQYFNTGATSCVATAFSNLKELAFSTCEGCDWLAGALEASEFSNNAKSKKM